MTSIGLGAAQEALQVHQPQQSVLYPHVGQRHTACIRNISVPQRVADARAVRRALRLRGQ